MTREKLKSALKPIKWVERPRLVGQYLANVITSRTAYAYQNNDGNLTVEILDDEGCIVHMYDADSLEEASSILRDWQLDELMVYIQLDDK